MKKYIKIISVVLIVIAIAGIGVVYGFFNYARTGQTQKVIAGSLYLTMNEGNDSITLANVFPETKEEARDATLHVPGTATNNTLTFTLKGKNTSENKDINYEILLNNGAETNGKERFETKDLVFDLIEIGENNEETLILDAVSYDELEDQKIWIDKVDKNTTDEIEITYKLRMWISDDVVISESDPDADYTPQEFKNRYASVKVAVEGDMEEKVLPLESLTENLLVLNNQTYFTNVIKNNDTENSQDTFELTITSSNNNVEFGYKDDAVIENISNANIDGKVSKLEINSNSKVKKLANELVVTSTFVHTFTIPKDQKATFNVYLVPKYDNDEATDLSFTLKKNNTTVQEFVKHVSLQGTKTGVPQIEFVNREATYSGTSVTLDNVTIKNSDNTAYTGTETYTYYNGTGCSGTPLVNAPINAGVYSVKIVAPGVGTDNDAIKCGTIKINKKNLTIKADDKSMNYNGEAPSYTYTATGFVNNETTSVLTGTINYVIKDGDTVVNDVSSLEAGTYTIVPSGTLEANNYNILYTNGTLTISNNELTPSIGTCEERQYNGNTNATCTIELEGVTEGDVVTATGTCTVASSSVGNGKAVTCTGITLGGKDASKYTLGSTTANKANAMNITTKTVTPVIDSCTNKVYDGTTAVTCTTSVNGRVGSESVSVTGTCNAENANVANGKKVTCSSLTLTGTDKDNYSLSANNVEKTGAVNITQRAVTVTTAPTLKSGTITYTGSNQNISGSAGSCSTGGTMYYYTANYTTTTAPTFSTTTGWSTTYPSTINVTNAGTYYLWYYCYVSDTSNNSGGNTAISITKAVGTKELDPSKFTASNTSKVYDGNTNKPSSFSISANTTSGLVSGDSVTVSYTSATYNNASVASANTISVSGISINNSNYHLKATTADYSATITKKEVTVTAANKSMSYGGIAPTYSYTATGAVGSETAVTGTVQYTIKSGNTTIDNVSAANVGSYSIVPSGLTAGGNYTINYVNGTLTISAVAATLSCSNKTYDGTEQTACSCNGGTVGGEYKAKDYRATAYTASCTPDSNHTAPSNETWTMSKRAVTVTAGSTERAWDNTALTNGTCTVTTGTLATNHTVSCTMTSASTITTAGTVNNTIDTVTIKDGSNNTVTSNYNVTKATGTLKINLATPTVSLSAKSDANRTYTGSPIAANTATVSPSAGGAITYIYYNGNSCSGDALSGAPTNAGTYSVKAKAAGVANKTNDAYSSCVNHSILKANTATLGSCANPTYNGSSQDIVTHGVGVTYSNNNQTNYNANGYTITVTPDDNHTWSNGTSTADTSLSCNITRKSVTPAVASCSNKTYDGTNSASCTYSAVSEKVGSETVSITGGTCTFADSAVGDGKTVTCTGITLTGANASNYQLSTTSATKTANITKKSVTPAISSCNNKEYDGTNSATCTYSAVSEKVGSETVSITGGTCTFADSNAADGKTVTCTGISLDGTNKGNYQLSTTSASKTANITKKAVTYKADDASKTYDGSALTKNTATKTAGDLVSGHTASFSISGTITNVGTATNTLNSVTIKNSSDVDVSSNYNITKQNGTLTVTANKTADEGECLNPTYNGSAQNLAGNGAHVTYSNNSQTNYKTDGNYSVTVTPAANYAWSDGTTAAKTLSCNITRKAVTYKADDASKVYDGSALTKNTATKTAGDLVNGHTATFSISGTITNVGTATNTLNSVTIKNSSDVDVSSNYNITKQNGTLTVTANKTADEGECLNPTYNGSAQNLAGNGAHVTYSNNSQTNYKTDGNYSVTVTPAANYAWSDGTTAAKTLSCNITRKAVTVTAGSTSRAWNNSALTNGTCTVTTGSLVTNHTVSCTMTSTSTITTAGTVNNTIDTVTIKDGSNNTVTSNYNVTKATGTLTVTLATPTVSLSAKSDANRTYTGSAIAANTATVSPSAGGAITYIYYNGNSCSGDALSGAPTNAGTYSVKAKAAAVANKTNDAYSSCVNHSIIKANTATLGSCANPTYNGSSQDIVTHGVGVTYSNNNQTNYNASGYTITVTPDANHTWSNGTSTADTSLSCNITRKSVTPAVASCSNKTYDGTDSASCTYSAVSEKVGSDVVSLTGGSCKFNNANVGTGKTVTCSSIGLTGANSGNYTLSTTSATSSANITALTLTASLSSCGKTYNGNVTAPCTVTYTNVQTGDSVTGTATCTYANKTVGTGKTVTCSSFTKTGTGNGNYAVPADGQTTTANITALALTAGTPSCNNKTYDGNTNASCTVNYTNVVDGDTVNADATCTFANADVGTGKTVTCSSFTKSGTDNGNYTVPSGNKTTTANITAQKCNTPTNISISSAGAITWTASSNCSTGSHQVKVESGSYATANSGVNKKSDIIAGTGTRTVYVKALAPNTNYSDSDAGTGTTTVYSVTLTKGTGISDVTGAGNYITGSTVTLGASVSTGYTWSKWTETSGGTQVSTTNAYSTTISSNWAYTANATINSYTVTYNYSANGGTSATKTTDTKNYNAAIDLTPTATKSGWTFVGWNTSQSATTGLSSLTMGTSNVTLYAIYRKEAITRKMTLYKNGNTSFTYNGTTYTDTSKSFDICTIPAVYNTATQNTSCSATITMATITASSNTPTLIGWSTGADNHTATYTSGQTNVSLTMDADKSFYAQTTKAAVDGTVTFNPNGNTNFVYPPAVLTATYTSTTAIKICDIAATYNGVAQASTCTATVTMPTITANGNTPTVIGWSTGVDTHTATYTSGQTGVTLTSGSTYYAQSQNNPSAYTITFNVNGNSGSNSSQSCTPATSYNGAAASTQCSITSPAISAHANTPTVLGWTSTQNDHTTGWAPQTARNISASGTYYAQTKSTDVTYSVTYNNDGATSGGASNTSCSPASTYNGTAPNTTCSITLASAPTKTSYVFGGWKSSTTNQTYNAGTSYTVTANTTLTAQWTQPWAENLSYDDTYGIGCSDAQCALDYVVLRS